MSAREEILSKLKGAPSASLDTNKEAPDTTSFFRSSDKGLKAQFREHFEALSGEFFEEQDRKAAAERLFSLLSEQDGPILTHKSELLSFLASIHPGLEERLENCLALSRSSDALSNAVAGISTADKLCASTGSILIRSSHAGGRRLSILSPFHIVIATESQLTSSLEPWLSEIREDDNWSLCTIISGPSRTADIEKILVLGAHGPKRLAVILCPG